jgi:hypothetical protein
MNKLGLIREKTCLLVYLSNKSLSLSLGLSINQAKLKHYNLFVNKFVSMKFNLSIYNIIVFIYIYLRLDCVKYVNKFIGFQIIIYNFLII